MMAYLRAAAAAGAALAGLSPVIAHAGGGSGNCHCTTPPPPCNCTVPTGHTVNVPGVNIMPPSITVTAPTISISGAFVDVQATSIASAQASAQSSAQADASTQANANGTAYANLNALASANSFGSGGGGGFSQSEGGSSSIPNLEVVGVEAPQARRICTQFRSVAKVTAVQAVCLDDKAIPHPASQVMPDRDVASTYEGEVFRCIAGARMQYTLADYAGSADFARGQTVSCQKGEALYHSAAGQLACRPQRPARDCNERSLLRRYGAGIKVLKLAEARECVAWSSETAEATGSASETMMVDGGVGGVVR